MRRSSSLMTSRSLSPLPSLDSECGTGGTGGTGGAPSLASFSSLASLSGKAGGGSLSGGSCGGSGSYKRLLDLMEDDLNEDLACLKQLKGGEARQLKGAHAVAVAHTSG